MNPYSMQTESGGGKQNAIFCVVHSVCGDYEWVVVGNTDSGHQYCECVLCGLRCRLQRQ